MYTLRHPAVDETLDAVEETRRMVEAAKLAVRLSIRMIENSRGAFGDPLAEAPQRR